MIVLSGLHPVVSLLIEVLIPRWKPRLKYDAKSANLHNLIQFFMDHALCIAAVAPLRKENSHRSEMVSQVLFGEALELVEQKDEWFYIRSLVDGYEGWLTEHLVGRLDHNVSQPIPSFVTTGLLSEVERDGDRFYIPMGSPLTGYSPETGEIAIMGYSLGQHLPLQTKAAPFFISQARQFLQAPYLWGGKTLMGIDCSGLMQVVFRTGAIFLKRDAYQQATEGLPVQSLHESQPGDLAFFNNDAGRITHVGLLIDEQTIIHASGMVRIDPITQEGIIHQQTGRKTHQLHSIRRVLGT